MAVNATSPWLRSPTGPARDRTAAAAASGQIVVGAIPQRPPGFQPLADLLAELDQSDAGVSVLTGIPGVGKTRLAAAYAQAKLAAGWRLVAWVNAGETGSMLAGLAAAAEAAGLSGSPERDAAGAGGALRRWLEADGERCLLVFDDAEDPDALRPFLPAGGAARVLITSSQQPAADLGSSVPLDVFSTDEAVEFLTGTTDLAEDEAAAVAAEVGHLPLALAAAAAVIGFQLGYETYLDRLRALSAEEYLAADEGQMCPPAAAKSVVLCLDAAQECDQTGVCRGVTEIMAVLSPGGVRRELLHAAGQAGVLVGGGQPVAASLVDRALERLADWSLLSFSVDSQTVIAHRLVIRAVRKRLDRQQQTAVCRAAARVLEARAEELAGPRDRQAARDISQHATGLLDSAPRPAAADDELTRVLLRLRFLALYQLVELGGSAQQAIAVGESLTADLETLLGTDHLDTLNSRNTLAAAYLAAGRVAEAIPLFKRTLVARERLLGPDHPDTLTSQNNLAAVYQDAGRVGEAILLFELTLAARERLLGSGHRSTVNSRSNLAAAYMAAGRVAEAIPMFEQTLVARQRLLGPDHPDTLRSRDNLAAAYREVSNAASAGRDARQVVVGAIPRLPPGFLPRPDLLAQLNRPGWGVLVLTGMPAVGMSQLAAAFARAKVAAGWRVVAWVNAANPAGLLAGLAAVADAAGLSDGGRERGAADASLAVRHWLEADGDRCLLIVDDAEDPDVLRPFLPVQGAARVLVTAARGSVADLGTSFPVGVFSAEEALALLNERTGLTDEAGASALAAELGYLPLAVDQAAALIARQYRGYPAYLRRLRALPARDYLSGDEESYPPGVAETVLLSLEAARGADREEVGSEVLGVVAVLSAAGVARELLDLAGRAGILAAGGRRVAAIEVDHALARLADQALLTFTIDGQTVLMHRLVASVIRDELARRKRLTRVCRAAASVLEARAEAVVMSPDRRAVRDLTEQATALLGSAGTSDEQLTSSLLRLRLRALDNLIESGDCAPYAIAVGESLAADLDQALGPDHPDTLSAQTGLAAAYHAAGRNADAIAVVEKTLSARERLLGADHPSTLTSRNNLASAYRTTGRPVEAVRLFEKNAAACERALGADHPKTLASRHSLDLARQEAAQAENADGGASTPLKLVS